MAEDKPTLAPFVAPTILDTTGSDRTDLKSVLQLFGDELAAQNQVLRKLIDHWDSISRLQFSGSVKKLFITRHQESGDPVLEYTFSDGAQNYKRL